MTQFVTLRLADSLPASRRSEWKHLLQIEDNRERRLRLEALLDRGWGECWLRRPDIAGIVEGALQFFEGKRYGLSAWIIMPNHSCTCWLTCGTHR